MSATERARALQEQINYYQHEQQQTLSQIHGALEQATQASVALPCATELGRQLNWALTPIAVQGRRPDAPYDEQNVSVAEQIGALSLLTESREYGELG